MKKYIECDCKSELLQIEYNEDDLNSTYITFYFIGKASNKNHFSLKDKLRAIWKIIRYGHPYSDGIVMNIDETIELKTFLNDIINKYLQNKGVLYG